MNTARVGDPEALRLAPVRGEPADDAPPAEDGLAVTVIEARPGWHLPDFAEMWRYRELLLLLTWRDINVRYKQTVLGAAWAVIQPFATMVVFSLFFSRAAGAAGSTIPYPVFAFAGLLPWIFFANAIGSASTSIVICQNLVTKIYFPRMFIPMGAVGAALVDFLVAAGMLAVMMLVYGLLPGWTLLLAPLLVLGLIAAAVGTGALLSALMVAYRDFRYIVPFGVQLWMFATPSIYMPVAALPEGWLRYALLLNPLHSLIGCFRDCILGTTLDPLMLAAAVLGSTLMLFGGALYFRRTERHFADII